MAGHARAVGDSRIPEGGSRCLNFRVFYFVLPKYRSAGRTPFRPREKRMYPDRRAAPSTDGTGAARGVMPRFGAPHATLPRPRGEGWVAAAPGAIVRL
jgi:hypothetical protein